MKDKFIKRGFLDADIIIKLGKWKGSDLLRKIVEYFDEVYLHKRIYLEVDFPPQSKKLLDELIEKRKLNLIEDRYLLNELDSKGLFLLTLEQACDFFNKDYYQEYYSNLHKINNSNEFLKRVEEIGKDIAHIGEIRTLQMIIILFSQANIDNYFLSSDGGARNGIVLNYARGANSEINLQGVPLMSLFHYLKDEIKKQEALDYVNNFAIINVRLYAADGSRMSVSKEEFIDMIYEEDYFLNKMGYIKLN